MLKRVLIAICVWIGLSAQAYAADPYTVAGVMVDAQAANALEAQTKAISEGQNRAANIIIERLSLPEQRAQRSFGGVTQEDSAKMIRALEIADERRSGSRYLGTITVAFNREAVRQYMLAKGLALVDTQARPRMVLARLDGQSAAMASIWSDAWQTGNFSHALTPLQSPELTDQAKTILRSAGAKPTLTALKQIGQIYGVQQVLLADAYSSANGYRVRLEDVALDTGQARTLDEVTAYTPEAAAQAVVSALENDWKASTVSAVSSASVTMPVSVLYRSHSEWLQLQDVINGAAQIRGARLEAISRGGALMTLTYGGDIERLARELSFKGVTLTQDKDMGTVLARSGAF